VDASLPSLPVALALFVGMLLFLELGRRLGTRWLSKRVIRRARDIRPASGGSSTNRRLAVAHEPHALPTERRIAHSMSVSPGQHFGGGGGFTT
jgi:hypothetical protein